MDNVPDDILFNILLKSDIETIKTYCTTHKNTLCDAHFWVEKFKHDHVLLFGQYPTIVSGWISKYEKMVKLKDTSKKILLINDIESTRINKRTNGIIDIHLDDHYLCSESNPFPEKMIKDVNTILNDLLLNNKNGLHVNRWVSIQPLNNQYQIKYYIFDSKNVKEYSTERLCLQKDDIINIFTHILYDNCVTISDNCNAVAFTIDKMVQGNYYSSGKKIKNRRLGMWDMLNHIPL